MTRERLELVRSFSELRTGMIVVDRHCDRCGAAAHRFLLLRSFVDEVEDAVGMSSIANGFDALPKQPCGADVVTTDCVEAGTLFRVIDDLETPDEYRRSISGDEDLAMVRATQRAKERAR